MKPTNSSGWSRAREEAWERAFGCRVEMGVSANGAMYIEARGDLLKEVWETDEEKRADEHR